MPERSAPDVMLSDSVPHPAVQAWHRVCPKAGEPNFVEVLQEVKKGTSRSCIYRLAGVGRERLSVIAKRCVAQHAHVEQTIYEQILSRLPISHLIFYGCVDEPETDFSWLFMEDAGGDHFAYCIEEHRKVATRWLAEMHVSAARSPAISRLPDRGPEHYLEHLHFTRETIQGDLRNSALSPWDLQVLGAVLSQADFIESRWNWVEDLYHRFPRTLVHCDFAKYNLRVRRGESGINLMAFDWEMAGRGAPAADIAELSGRGVPRRRATRDFGDSELVAYWSIAREAWSGLRLSAIKQLAELGAVFRSLAAISWESESIRRGWWPIKELQGYQVDLAVALEHLGFRRQRFADDFTRPMTTSRRRQG
jgi:Ser/Thr protein kinase RdoA (MazF antagonist)